MLEFAGKFSIKHVKRSHFVFQVSAELKQHIHACMIRHVMQIVDDTRMTC